MQPANVIYVLILWHPAPPPHEWAYRPASDERLAQMGLERCDAPHGLEKDGRTWQRPIAGIPNPRKAAKAAVAALASSSIARDAFFIDQDSIIQEGAEFFRYREGRWTTEADEDGPGFLTLENVKSLCANRGYVRFVLSEKVMNEIEPNTEADELARFERLAFEREESTRQAIADAFETPGQQVQRIAKGALAAFAGKPPTIEELHALWMKCGAPADYAEQEARALAYEEEAGDTPPAPGVTYSRRTKADAEAKAKAIVAAGLAAVIDATHAGFTIRAIMRMHPDHPLVFDHSKEAEPAAEIEGVADGEKPNG